MLLVSPNFLRLNWNKWWKENILGFGQCDENVSSVNFFLCINSGKIAGDGLSEQLELQKISLKLQLCDKLTKN